MLVKDNNETKIIMKVILMLLALEKYCFRKTVEEK